MNRLSWLLYWGNVAGNLATLAAIFGLALVILAVLLLVRAHLAVQEARDAYHRDDDRVEKALRMSRTTSWFASVWIVLAFCLFVSAALCPSPETVYAIAASEVGEKALNTETGGLATQALNAWLKRQINPPAPASKQP